MQGTVAFRMGRGWSGEVDKLYQPRDTLSHA